MVFKPFARNPRARKRVNARAHVRSEAQTTVPGPTAFLCAILKSWNGPGGEAMVK